MKRSATKQTVQQSHKTHRVSDAKLNVPDFNEIESRWQRIWSENNTYTVELSSASKPYYNLMMFPYPSAEGLHVGNMYAFTGSDVFGRFKRLQGFDVFEPIGLDGFGIHSENFAMKIGRHPMEHAEITQKNYYNQLKKIGAMFDWSRTVQTYDTDYYRWTQWLFIQMFKHGLAYRDTAEVNWCPQCKTVLADEQVIDEKCERCGNIVEKRSLEQWFFRITAYAGKLLSNSFALDWSEKVKVAQKNWIGKKEGVVIHHKVKDLEITLDAFSAYPAWLFADTFLVIAPDHPVVKQLVEGTAFEKDVNVFIEAHKKNKRSNTTKQDEKAGIFTGRYVTDPFSGSMMPVWLANFALMGFGTGIIRCSAHDPRDYEFAQKYHIALKEVVERTDKEAPVFAHENTGILIDSGPFSGKGISPILIVEMVDWIVKKGIGKREITYHLRDWLISRQRYWGPPIPMIKCPACLAKGKGERQEMPGWYCQPESDLPVILPRIEDFRPGDDGIAPLAKHKEFYETKCPQCGGKAVRETDVSDTFLDSSWYFLRYPSLGSKTDTLPWNPEITKKWLPVNMYTGGAEHSVLHLMYSRFVTMALKDWGYIDFEEPFSKFYAHGLVIKDGAKMSKSKGNVVNPDEYINTYGADALRLYLMFMGPFDQGGDFRDTAMEGMSRWVGRIWRLGKSSATGKMRSSPKIIGSLQKLISKVTDDMEKRRYNTAIASMMEFTNLIADENGELGVDEFKTLLLLLAPFAPHVTEELWQKVDSGHKNRISNEFISIHTQSWPVAKKELLQEEPVVIAIQVNGKLRDTLEVAQETGNKQEEIVELAHKSEKVSKYINGLVVKKIIFVPGKLLNFVVGV